MLPKHWYDLTLETDPHNIITEFKKKYRGCYVWVNKTLTVFNNYDVIHPDSDPGDPLNLVAMFTPVSSSDQPRIRVGLLDNVELSVYFPRIGNFTSAGDLYTTIRRPLRQYRKGPCSDNMEIIKPLGMLSNSHSMLSNSHLNVVDTQAVIDCFAPTELDYTTAYDLIMDREIRGAALSNQFGVTVNPFNKRECLLYYYTTPIGFANKSNIKLEVPELRQELLDFRRDNHLHLDIN